MQQKNIIEDIKHILQILFENRHRLFQQLFSKFTDSFYEIHDTNATLTNDFTTPWYHVYSLNEYHEIANEVDRFMDIIHKPEPGTIFEETYNKLVTMHNYFSTY